MGNLILQVGSGAPSMLFIDPLVSMRTVVGLLSTRPKLLVALPIVVVCEMISAFLATLDSIRSTEEHAVWRRVEG